MNDRQQADEKRQREPFDRTAFAAEVAGQMRKKGEAELSGVAKYYRMAGLPAKRAVEMAALQAADILTRYLTQGMISATVDAMEAEGGGKGMKTFTVGPARPLRLALDPWEYYVKYIVQANGIEIAEAKVDYDVEMRLEILDAALRRWPDGGYELSLGRARFSCLIYLLRPGGKVLIANPRTREVSFAEPISYGGSWTPEEEKPACPFGSPSACPYRLTAEGESPAKPG
ncbi:MAG: hypothetical protein ABFC89_13165 [Methanospirillum sp.]